MFSCLVQQEVVMPKFRAKKAVEKLLDSSAEPTVVKVPSLVSLVGHAYLDQKGRPRRPPARETAKRLISIRYAKRVRLLTLACMSDRVQREDPKSPLKRRLLRRIFKNGGLSCIADGESIDDLIDNFKSNEKEVRHVVQIVDYLVRTEAFPECGFPSTIQDAKAFAGKWIEEYGGSKISQLWENFKLVAPYLYALSLERSFQPHRINNFDDVLSWALCFVQNRQRVERFIGRAAYVMDVLKNYARDQRESDFVGVLRVAPPLRRFDEEEKLIIANIDRNLPIA
jgi:hypothetical protein